MSVCDEHDVTFTSLRVSDVQTGSWTPLLLPIFCLFLFFWFQIFLFLILFYSLTLLSKISSLFLIDPIISLLIILFNVCPLLLNVSCFCAHTLFQVTFPWIVPTGLVTSVCPCVRVCVCKNTCMCEPAVSLTTKECSWTNRRGHVKKVWSIRATQASGGLKEPEPESDQDQLTLRASPESN